MPLIACLTATLLSCYSDGDIHRARLHLPTEPSRFEFYPQYDHDLFVSRFGGTGEYNHDKLASRFGAGEGSDKRVIDDLPVQQVAMIYSDNPAELITIDEPRTDKRGKKRAADERGKSKIDADDGRGKTKVAEDDKRRKTDKAETTEEIVADKRSKRTKIVIDRDNVELAYAEPDSKGGWLSTLFRNDIQTTVPKVKGIDMNKEGYQEVAKAAREHGVPVDLALRVARQESGGNCGATSHAGAGGVMQVMPKTAAKHGVTKFKKIYDCRTGAQTGVRELKHLLKIADGDIKQTLIGYNCGERCMHGKRKKLPAETVNYVAAISGKKK
jgi:hypothetical protein